MLLRLQNCPRNDLRVSKLANLIFLGLGGGGGGGLVEMPYKSCPPPPPNKIASYAYACTVNNHDCTHYLLISPAADLMNIHISFSCRVHYEEQCYSFVCPSTPEGNLTMQLQVLVNTTYVISIYYLNIIIKWLNRYNLNCIHYKLNLTKQESL